MAEAIETLVGIRSEDLRSPVVEVRCKALRILARNERTVLGRVSPALEQALLRAEEELVSLSDNPC